MFVCEIHLGNMRIHSVVITLMLLLLLRAAGAQDAGQDGQFLWMFLQNALPPQHSSAFNRSVSPCLWPGIRCSSGSRVTEVSLPSTGLTGLVPHGSLGKLDMLESLNLSNNSLSGSIPDDLWSELLRLQSLNLSTNRFSGSIAASQFNCILLKQLDLSGNRLSGSVPSMLAHLTQLQLLDLHGNLLHDILPHELNRLHYLTLLDLSENRLTGPFPPLDGLRKLEIFNISKNSFSGRVPAGALRIPALRIFSARQNRLVGSLPVPSTKQNSILLIDLGMNGLSGDIPAGIWNLISLQTLRLDVNMLSGSLPQQVGPALTKLDLSRNQFNGSVADQLTGSGGAFQRLVFLDLSSNRFSGVLPGSLIGFPRLVHLGLANNPFVESRFPDIRQGLPAVEYMNLEAVQLIGPIPGEIGRLRTLKQLDLSHNELNGSLPESLGALASLTSLDLSFNNLKGSIPESFRKLTGLRSFNVSYNDLSGSVPDVPFITSQGVLGNKNLCGRAIRVACPASASEGRKKKHIRSAVLIGIITGCMAAAVGLVACFLCCRRVYPVWQKKKEAPKEERYISMSGPFSSEMDPSVWASGVREPHTIPVVMFEKPLLNLTFSDILQATSNFSKEAQLTDTGCGPLFQGLLPGGIHVTVMVLGEGIPLDNVTSQLQSIGRLKHPNVAPLLGYCMVGVERLLIYEYVQDGGDLYSRLHELPEGVQNTEDWSTDTWEHGQETELRAPLSGVMTWSVRHKVALGTARALAFLHHGCHPPVVHGDVKASNVLLDSDFEARLAGTGLRQLVEIETSEPGYVPPEFTSGSSSEVNTKGDVFSFGVLLLELVTGKRPVGDDYGGNHHGGSVVQWTRSLIKDKRGFKALDVKVMKGEEDMSEMLEALRVAYLCTAESPGKRPTMQQVVGLLKDLRPASGNSGEVWGSF